ncbi:MAG: type III pantothenate kinase [bacterium]
MKLKRDYSDFIAIDVGNSRVKVLYQNEIKGFDTEGEGLNGFGKYFKELQKSAKKNSGVYTLVICIASVNDVAENKILEIIEPYKLEIIKATEALKRQKLIDFSLVRGMGCDRKLGLIGAFEYLQSPFITVDIGTAITINVLDKTRCCRGGVILPGPFTQVKSLEEHTAGLGKIKLSVSAEVAGLNTVSAVGNGIIYGICGAIREIIDLIRIQIPGMAHAKVIMTGGGSKLVRWILRVLEYDFKFEEDLVVRGILRLMRSHGVKK